MQSCANDACDLFTAAPQDGDALSRLKIVSSQASHEVIDLKTTMTRNEEELSRDEHIDQRVLVDCG